MIIYIPPIIVGSLVFLFLFWIKFKNNKPRTKGGDAGKVIIYAEEILGDGKITANGGDGDLAGNGGEVNLYSRRNNFTGVVSANAGNALLKLPWYQTLWGIVLLSITCGLITHGIIKLSGIA